MVLKMRELRETLRELGFESRPGRGSHEVWVDPAQPRRRVVLHGKDCKDAHRYQAAQVRKYRRGMVVYE
jgi:predicted RNA binding protein YcfA (HicA-like mRNA interferase family)